MMSRQPIITLALLVALLSACAAQPPAAPPGAAGDAGEGPTRVGFAGMAFEKATYQPIIDAFNAANPDLQVEYVPLEPDFSGTLEETARAVASAADTFVQMLAGPEAGETGVAADLRPLLDADSAFNRADFEPGTLPASGPIYTLPTHVGVQTLGYNRDLMAGAAPPAPGATWGDLLALAEQLTWRRGDEVEVHGLDDGQDGRLALFGLLAEAGVPLSPGPDGALDLDRPEVATALARVADLLERGVLYRRPDEARGAISFDTLSAHIRDGRTAMWIGGASLLSGPLSGESSFEAGEAALPALPRDLALSTRGYMLSAGSAHPEAAWRWLSYLSRQEPVSQGQMFFIGMGVEAPARRSLAERSGFWQTLPPERAAAVRAALDAADALPPASDQLVRGNLDAALSATVSGTPAERAIAEHAARLADQLAERAASPAATSEPPPVRLPDPDIVPEGATAITFGAFGPELGALRDLARRFNAEGRGVHVTVEPPRFEGEPFDLAAIAARYDCLVWPQPPGAAERETLRDLRPLLDADATIEQGDYPAGLLAPYSDGGALYGLPYAVQLRALTYNRGAFEAAGLAAPRAGWALADMLETARLLTDKADRRYGYAVDGSHSADLLAFLGWQGAEPVVDGAPGFTDGRVAQAIQSYLDLLRDYSPHTALQGYAASGFFDGATLALTREGRVGMWHTGGLDVVIALINDGQQSEPPDLAIAPPALGARGLTRADVSASAMHISASSQHPEACWEWMRFLSEQPGGLGEHFPARASVATSEAFLQQARPGAAEVYAAYAGAQADPASAADPYAGVDFYWLMRAVDRAFQGGDLERELAEAQTLTTQYITCVGGGGEPADCAKSVDSSYDGVGVR